ncbi:hypothetical protein [Exiguobacterium sp. s80]|uniref:hypothetical protein n=1 Tax=Exiguobacterium sp. s80 TaxID=2751209 RepID=UPI001BECA5FD|nr:hypothetical protein [Exiguobacterium sp. s80]
MSNSKKEIELLYKLFSNFLSNLTNEQYLQLVNGESELKLVSKKIDTNTIQVYKMLLQDIISVEDIEERKLLLSSHLNKKSDLINLSDFLNIPTKSKDTIKVMLDNIIEYTIENEDYIKNNVKEDQKYEKELSDLINQIEATMDTNEAKELLKNSSIAYRKADLMNFAKKLSVFPDKRSSADDIINEIVQAVVEAKIRSYKIRKKL